MLHACGTIRWCRTLLAMVVVAVPLGIPAVVVRPLAGQSEPHIVASEGLVEQFLVRGLCLPDTDLDMGNQTRKYRLLCPEELQPEATYPLVLYLHGAGERGSDGIGHLSGVPALFCRPVHRHRFPCFLLAPQCPARCHWNDVWVGTDGEETARLDVVMNMVDEVKRNWPVDANRIYVVGFSMGGYGCWELTCRYPDAFAAAVPIGGDGDASRVNRLVDLPIWAIHGADDRIIRPNGVREMIRELRRQGGTPKYSELAKVGHDAWRPALQDSNGVWKWLFEQGKDTAMGDERTSSKP